jgi:serine/threonine protein kinase
MGGESSSKASDVYAFAMILLELLTLKPAWHGVDPQVVSNGPDPCDNAALFCKSLLTVIILSYKS